MLKSRNAFTIVELLVVIAIIGILTTISVVSYSNLQANSRDSQRSSKITVIAEALEKYYDKNGEYPSCAAMSASVSTVAISTLKGIDPNALSTPSASNGTNSILAACASLTAGSDAIAYIGDNSATCSSTNCLQYTLQYREESTGQIKSINSRRKTDVATSGNITNLAATAAGLIQVNLNWGSVSNATDYTVQRATNSGFTTGLSQTASAANSTSITGLTAGTTYYFRVAPNSASGIGNWSNVVNATTPQLSTPVATATVNSLTQITLDWGDVSLATSYTAQLSTSSSFTSPTIASGLTTSTKAFTGLVAGTTYYLRVQALATGDTSDWSATVSAIILATPVATATANSSSQITLDWGDITGATSYTAQLSTSSSFTSPTIASGLTTSTKAFTGLAQGTVYYLRVEALNANGTSSWSATVSDNTYYTMVATSSSSNTTNVFPATVDYNSGGYTGTLSKNGASTSNTVQTGGSYTPSDSFTATDSRGSYSNSLPGSLAYNSGGYSGTLYGGGTYVSSGAYTPSDTQYVTVGYGAFTVEDWCWWAGGSMWYDHDSGYPASTYAYNSGGYVGTLSLSYYETSGVLTQYAYYDWDSAHLTNNTGYYNTKHHYMQGSYVGNVTRPASDTRYYSQNYSGTVTKPAVDTRTWLTTYTQNYSGTVIKP